MGGFKELKIVHRIVVDCMYNVHPIYAIKELMIKKELGKNPDLKDENWERFLPKFKKQNVKRRTTLQEKQKKKKKEYTPFPPEQLLRKEDYQMMSGEYFLTDKQKDEQKETRKRDEKEQRKVEKVKKQNA